MLSDETWLVVTSKESRNMTVQRLSKLGIAGKQYVVVIWNTPALQQNYSFQ